MAAVTTVVLAVASLVVAAGAAYMQYKQGQKMARAQRKAQAISSAEQRAQQQAQLRQQVRAERIRRAQIIQSSQNDGVTGSSGMLGAESSLGSMIDNNIASLGRQSNSSAGISRQNQIAADAGSRANTWQQVGQVAQASFGYLSQTDSFQNMFSPQKTPNKVPN